VEDHFQVVVKLLIILGERKLIEVDRSLEILALVAPISLVLDLFGIHLKFLNELGDKVFAIGCE